MRTDTLTSGQELVDPAYYGEFGPPHEMWTALRHHSPVYRCEPRSYPAFWAVTGHDEILEISTQPDIFLNQPGIVLTAEGYADRSQGVGQLRTIVEMDPPEHRAFRKVAAPFFTPRSIARYEEATRRSAKELIDALAGTTGEGECDFATDLATAHPLRILSTLLGLPREQEPTILRLTNQLFGSDDAELARPGVDHQTAMMEIAGELFAMFEEVITDRRAHPREDLISIIANGLVDGEPMGPLETFGYCLITFTAGHDTTKNALAGGLNAFIEHPDQLELLRQEPDLLPSAVDEVIRWASPVNYMMRTAKTDAEVAGQKISAGDHLLQFYASANRDERHYDEPFAFRIDREANKHMGFGIGEHYCMGAHLARMSQRALLDEFSRRVVSIERTGDPQWISSSFVVGYKHLPVRYRFTV